MIGFDEREQCEYCVHAAACHASHWEDGQTLRLDACEVDGCNCEVFVHDPWMGLEKLPQVAKNDSPVVTPDRRLFLIQWEYKTMEVMPGAGWAADQEFSAMGKQGWELVDRSYPHGIHEGTLYRFRRPRLKGTTP